MPIKFRANVIKGTGRGKELGYPTINLTAYAALDVKPGVHVCQAKVNNTIYWGLLFFGPRPVFNDFSLSLEVHLLDFDASLKIPRQLEIEVHQYIRPVLDFGTGEDLAKQIKKDIRAAQKYIN